MDEIYLDHASCGPASEEARLAMQPFLEEQWGTPSSPCRRGQGLIPPLEMAYQQIYKLLGASPADRLVVTGSGAEAITQVMMGVYQTVSRETGKNHIVVGGADDAPSILAVGQLESLGVINTMAPINREGQVTETAVAESLSPRTALCSLSLVHPLTGVIQPVESIARVCKERGVLLHLDVTHLLGRGYFDWCEYADFITFNGNQWGAPHDVGGLVVKEGRSMVPLVIGGQPNVAGTVGMGAAAVKADQQLDTTSMELARKRNMFEKRLCEQIPEAQPLFTESERAPHICCVAFEGVSAEALLYAMNQKRVAATFGGGCQQRLSLILESAGYPAQISYSTLSFALGVETSDEELIEAIDRIGECYRRLRKVSLQLEEVVCH